MILSIDIGLRNLSLCVMSAEQKTDIASYKIYLWDVYNILDTDDYKCSSVQKNGKICGKRCLYKYKRTDTTEHCCKTHFPKDLLPIGRDNSFRKKAVNEYLLQDIALIVISKMDDIREMHPDIFSEIDSVIIELQPKMARKMIFVSHIIYGKLVEIFRGSRTTVRFVRASQKLKAYTGPSIECVLKGSYAKRKWLSIQYTTWFLQNKMSEEQRIAWLDKFLLHNKRDDLSDCYLMCINGLHGIPKRNIVNSC